MSTLAKRTTRRAVNNRIRSHSMEVKQRIASRVGSKSLTRKGSTARNKIAAGIKGARKTVANSKFKKGRGTAGTQLNRAVSRGFDYRAAKRNSAGRSLTRGPIKNW